MTLTEPVIIGALSPSRAGDFMTCPLLYRFRVIDQLPEKPSAAAVRGTVVHAVLERLYDLPAPRRTVEAAQELLEPQWAQLLSDEPALRRDVRRRRGAGRRGWRRRGRCWSTTSRWRTRRASSPPRGSSTWRRCSTAASCCAATSTGSTSRRAARCGSSTTRPAARPREAFEAKALFQMKFYALVLWRLRGVVPAQLQLIYLRRRRDAALRARRGRSAGHRAHGAGAVDGDRAGRWRPATGGRSASRLCDWCDHQALCPAFGGTPPPVPDRQPGDTVRSNRRAATDRA